jgi:hypothetical protein
MKYFERRVFAPGFINYKKRCSWLAAASDKVYKLLANDRWFSPGTPASSTTNTGRHDIAQILLKVALKHQNKNQITTHTINSYVLLEHTGFQHDLQIKWFDVCVH